MFEYHTYLHHSQTILGKPSFLLRFEYHTYLHHSQTLIGALRDTRGFEYHTYLHHSQTIAVAISENFCLSTIHIYIILKLSILCK